MATQQTAQTRAIMALAALVIKVAREAGDPRPAAVIVAPICAAADPNRALPGRTNMHKAIRLFVRL